MARLIFSVLFFVLALMIGPWLFVWALNTMIIWSGLVAAWPIGSSAVAGPIIFNFWSWLAAVILGGFGWIAKR